MRKLSNAISNPAVPTKENPLRKRVFRFLHTFGDKMGTQGKYTQYEPPKLKMPVGKKWFVAYRYRVPVELQHLYKSEWKRFKVYENINRYKDPEYAKKLLDAVMEQLQEGYNPFERELQELAPDTQEKEKQWTIQQSVSFWEQKWRERGIKEQSLDEYFRTSSRFLSWLVNLNIQNTSTQSITKNTIERYLQELKKANAWSNRSYNNERSVIKMIFGFLKDEGIIKINPTVAIHKQKTKSKKHRAYDERALKQIVEGMEKYDPLIYFAFQIVYHLCIRSEKELRLFKVSGIIPDRMQVFLSAEDTKTGADRYVPMSEAILKIFRERGTLNYPGDYYVFSAPNKYKFVPDATPGQELVGESFFSKRFAKVRKKVGLPDDYTLYGAKHTRVVHLKQDGVSDADIMALTGHKDFASYAAYLRDLGIDVNPDTISKNTRDV